MKRVIPVFLASLLLSACSYGELLEFVEGSAGGGDLSAPENPTDVQAAGSTTDARSDDEKAQAEITQALDPDLGVGTKIALANDAVQSRPADPRYLMYRSWFNLIAGDEEAAKADLAAAYGLAQEAYGGGPTAERRYAEFYLDATAAVMLTYPEDSETRERMEFVYCIAFFKYREDFGSSLLGSAYLDFKAHQDLCT
ncbi:MAG: hypothetical protein WD652_04125 [Acidimicrobiia bacterium]